MDPYNNYLITILYGNELLQCALRTELALEDVGREGLHGLLPLHVRNCGPVVKVECIFDISVESE